MTLWKDSKSPPPSDFSACPPTILPTSRLRQLLRRASLQRRIRDHDVSVALLRRSPRHAATTFLSTRGQKPDREQKFRLRHQRHQSRAETHGLSRPPQFQTPRFEGSPQGIESRPRTISANSTACEWETAPRNTTKVHPTAPRASDEPFFAPRSRKYRRIPAAAPTHTPLSPAKTPQLAHSA